MARDREEPLLALDLQGTEVITKTRSSHQMRAVAPGGGRSPICDDQTGDNLRKLNTCFTLFLPSNMAPSIGWTCNPINQTQIKGQEARELVDVELKG